MACRLCWSTTFTLARLTLGARHEPVTAPQLRCASCGVSVPLPAVAPGDLVDRLRVEAQRNRSTQLAALLREAAEILAALALTGARSTDAPG